MIPLNLIYLALSVIPELIRYSISSLLTPVVNHSLLVIGYGMLFKLSYRFKNLTNHQEVICKIPGELTSAKPKPRKSPTAVFNTTYTSSPKASIKIVQSNSGKGRNTVNNSKSSSHKIAANACKSHSPVSPLIPDKILFRKFHSNFQYESRNSKSGQGKSVVNNRKYSSHKIGSSTSPAANAPNSPSPLSPLTPDNIFYRKYPLKFQYESENSNTGKVKLANSKSSESSHKVGLSSTSPPTNALKPPAPQSPLNPDNISYRKIPSLMKYIYSEPAVRINPERSTNNKLNKLNTSGSISSGIVPSSDSPAFNLNRFREAERLQEASFSASSTTGTNSKTIDDRESHINDSAPKG
ncbi:hypothetical protein HK098_007928 [Nowakowskiella sp. JEL0407]|nr:hypothetical protein HK098_007928 [Nowakowskiella sp. JEL0407]